jgi:hypothetical protein
MTVPADLTAALDALAADPRIEFLSGWEERPDRLYSLKLRAQLEVPPTVFVPEWSSWHLVLGPGIENPQIEIYPDAVNGISATFQHQDNNALVAPELDWRFGKPCLERPAAIFKRTAWGGEPEDLAGRLHWRLGRLLQWIDAAASGTLVEDGDPLELPSFPALDQSAMLGFRETEEEFDWWTKVPDPWGFATIVDIPGSAGTSVIADFMDSQRHSVRKIEWSEAIQLDPGRIDAIWMTLPMLAVIAPWQAPSSLAELSALCAELSIDFPAILAAAGGKLRRYQKAKDATGVHLLIGFPLSDRLGEEPRRFHWIAARDVRLAGRDDIRKGFRNRAEDRRAWDREYAMSKRRLIWRKTANWAPDQLRKRGEAEDEVRAKSILVIGAGSLGSAIAENLLRMGVTRLGLLDSETLLVGNLSRHLLTMDDTGASKAVRMAARLNLAAPDADVEPLVMAFPPTSAADIERLSEWDVIVDCTASDAVLHAMASYPWDRERLFVSLSMTWEAKSLFAYSVSEAAFPAIDAIERFSAVSPPPDEARIGEMEGIGCWHPIFPATADDVNLWAAIGSKFVRRAVLEGKRTAVLYTQSDDGSVERRDA